MDDEKNIMTPGAKAIISYDAPFLNSDCVFIEYHDVIKSPWFVLLMYLQNNAALQQIFDTTELIGLDIDELYEWYVNRKERNIFLNLPLQEGVFEQFFKGDNSIYMNWVENFLNDEVDKISQCVLEDSSLNFAKTLPLLLSGTLVKKIYMYTEMENNTIREEIANQYGDKVNYVYGDIDEIIKNENIGNNSTFVFSDIEKISHIEGSGILNLSSIAIADRYGYNYNDDGEPKINVDELADKYIYKLDYFDNLTHYEEDDE